MITIGHYLTVARVPLSPWGEGRGEGAVMKLSFSGTPPSHGADDGLPHFSAVVGRAGLSPRGEATTEQAA
jgi:hypothetical protein